MWRSLFVAGGVYLILLGIQCLGVEKFVLTVREPPKQAANEEGGLKPGPKKEISPSPWAPWSLMGTGAVVCLYSFSIPSRLQR
jgi:hypothetical protein